MQAHAHHTHQPTTTLAVSTEPPVLQPGRLATWTFALRDGDRPVTDIQVAHERPLHLIVVSQDLSWFNHLHPEDQGAGVFALTAALPRAGAYRLYADITRAGASNEVLQAVLTVAGDGDQPAAPSLAAEPSTGMPWTQRIVSAPEGAPDLADGSTYEVALTPTPTVLHAGEAAMLHFQVRDERGQPLHDLQPYLGAMGHAVILSAGGDAYLHAHPLDAAGDGHAGVEHGAPAHGGTAAPSAHHGSDVVFHTTFPAAGLYKAWGQFRHRDRILTAAFVLQVA